MSTSATENYEKLLAAAELTDSERCHLLSSKRRRIVCNVLAEEDAPIGFEELATTVFARENAAESGGDVKIALHHVHLPKLDAAGVIDYDVDARQISVNQAGLGQLTE